MTQRPQKQKTGSSMPAAFSPTTQHSSIFTLQRLLAIGALIAAAAFDIASPSKSDFKRLGCPASTKEHASLKQKEAAMNAFAKAFYTEKDLSKAFNGYIAKDYIQHNANILDGREAAMTALAGLFNASDPSKSFEVKRVMVGDSYTTIHVKASPGGGQNLVVADIYRTIGTCVVEHWDVLQTIQSNTISKHPYF